MSHLLPAVELPSDRLQAVPRDVRVDDAPQRARTLLQLRERHWTMLWLSVIVIVASFVFEIRDGHTVGLIGCPRITLPETCGSRALFGIECPGCGLTRSFIALVAGDLAESMRYNRVGWILGLAVVLQIPYRLYSLRQLRTQRVTGSTWPKWFGNLLIVLLIGNWLLKISQLY